MAKNKVPKELQGVLWSIGVDKLDTKKNAPYIVNQVLAYGTMEHLKWLIKTYSIEKIKEVFKKSPSKVYTQAGFDWVTSILLQESQKPDERKYVETFP
ncbi:MAG: hypothetical protein AAB656_00545, partial [Patescibacteria group bacterium]